MTPRIIAAFVAALCAFGSMTIPTNASGPFTVGIHLRVDPSIASRRITDRLKNEAEAIWGLYGIRLEWTNADGASGANSISVEASVERDFEKRPGSEEAAVLGRVVMESDIRSSRPIRVAFDATERTLARRPGRSTTTGIVLDRELASALGRVLAHEIGHVLLGAPFHDRAGLMRAAFAADELGKPDRMPFRLTCSGVDRLRGRVRALTGDSQLVSQRDSEPFDLDGLHGTPGEFPGGTSCIAIQPAR